MIRHTDQWLNTKRAWEQDAEWLLNMLTLLYLLYIQPCRIIISYTEDVEGQSVQLLVYISTEGFDIYNQG